MGSRPFHRAGEKHIRHPTAVEFIEIAASVESFGNFHGAVAAEIKQDDRIAVFDFAHRVAVAGDDKFFQILIEHPGMVRPQLVDGLQSGGECTSLSVHMTVPAPLHHRPVGIVAVHGDVEASTAGGDAVIRAVVV